MSLIHQALKKAQMTQDTDALPVSNREGRNALTGDRHMHPGISAANIRILSVFAFFIIAATAGWWAANRLWQSSPAQVITGGTQPLLQSKSGDERGQEAGQTRRQDGKRISIIYEKARGKNLRGMELYRQGKFSLAKNEFLSSVEIFSEYAEAYNNLGLAYKQLGDMKDAEDSYKMALQYKPDYPEAMNNYGVLLDSLGNASRAQEFFKKSILIAPDYPDPYLNMAISLEKDKMFEQAISYYEGFLSRMKQGDDPLIKNVRERMLYLNLNRFAVQ